MKINKIIIAIINNIFQYIIKTIKIKILLIIFNKKQISS